MPYNGEGQRNCACGHGFFFGDMEGETSTFSGDMLLDLDVEFGWIGRRGEILTMGS